MRPPTKVSPSPFGVCEEVSPTAISFRGDSATRPASQGPTSTESSGGKWAAAAWSSDGSTPAMAA